METADYAISANWPAPNPELTAALIGSVLRGQGFGEPLDRAKSKPWAAGDFDRCSGWIADALKGAELTLDEVREGVMGGWYLLWPMPDGVMVTEMILSPRLRAIHVFAAGGTMRAIKEITPAIEEFARLAGCNFGGASGRKGWTRALKPLGYAPAPTTTVEKAL